MRGKLEKISSIDERERDAGTGDGVTWIELWRFSGRRLWQSRMEWLAAIFANTNQSLNRNDSVATLEEAVRVTAKCQLNKDLQDSEVKDIVAFLKNLTGEFPPQNPPVLPQ